MWVMSAVHHRYWQPCRLALFFSRSPVGRPQGEDDGQSLLAVGDYLGDRDGEKPIGVYALYDACRELQFVSYSRNLVLSVKVGCPRLQRTLLSHSHQRLYAQSYDILVLI